jgi:peptide/nickel transport system ATP-binding protein
VTLHLRERSIVGLVGASGSGKSTLARCLAGLEEPDSGEVRLDGVDLFRLHARERRSRRHAVQLIFQSAATALSPWLSLEEIVAEPLAIQGLPTRQRRDEALRFMDLVGLERSWRRRRAHELSGGQRQRVALARALAAGPRVLLLDEALSGLDLPVQARMIDLLRKLQESLSLTYLVITHSLRLVGSVAGEIAVMHEGSIVEHGGAAELFANPRHPRTVDLLNAIPRLPAEAAP